MDFAGAIKKRQCRPAEPAIDPAGNVWVADNWQEQVSLHVSPIGTKRTCTRRRSMSAYRDKPDSRRRFPNVCL
jgi:hypothetical protein